MRIILFFCLLCSSCLAFATSESRDVAQSWEWLKLLQYSEYGQSEVDRNDFFVSPTGASDPQSELDAFIHLARQSPKETACRFPARYELLRTHALVPFFDIFSCEEFTRWLRTDDPQGISLVFADGYLKNPASFHGHLFVKINGKHTQKGNLFDSSLNFGAVVPESDDPVTYIIKGLFGGYRAKYSAQPFYRHNISYAQEELRNLWHYQLNLSRDKVRLLAAHLYEVSKIDYQYFFMSKNCAYFVARSLELVLGQNIVHADHKTIIPTEVLNALASVQGGHYVAQIHLEKSLQAQFQEAYQQSSFEMQQRLQKHIEENILATIAQIQDRRALQILNLYYGFRVRQEDQDTHLRQMHKAVQRALLQQPILAKPIIPNTQYQFRPHDAQPAGMIRFHLGRIGDESYTAVSARPTYYDTLQPAFGRPAFSSMSMAEFELRVFSDKVFLEKFWLLNIANLNLSSTGLPGDGGNSWGVTLGFERERLRHADARLTPVVRGFVGQAKKIGAAAAMYASANLAIHSKAHSTDSHYATFEPRLGIQWRLWQSLGKCEMGAPFAITSHVTEQNLRVSCALSYTHSKRSDLRLTIERQYDQNIQISYTRYF